MRKNLIDLVMILVVIAVMTSINTQPDLTFGMSPFSQVEGRVVWTESTDEATYRLLTGQRWQVSNIVSVAERQTRWPYSFERFPNQFHLSLINVKTGEKAPVKIGAAYTKAHYGRYTSLHVGQVITFKIGCPDPRIWFGGLYDLWPEG